MFKNILGCIMSSGSTGADLIFFLNKVMCAVEKHYMVIYLHLNDNSCN